MTWSCQDDVLQGNLSVPGLSVSTMFNRYRDSGGNDTATTQLVFADPVGYLAGLGLTAEIVAETALPAAA
jgi:hypothetical protein